MDWGKAKNYTIIFLVLLNIFLFIFNLISDKRYFISDEQISNISELLQKNDIKLNAEIPTDFKPMWQVVFEKNIYDETIFQKIFFQEGEKFNRTSDFEKTILSSENKKITIFEDFVEFQSFQKSNDFSSMDKALNFSNSYIKKISEFFEGFSLYQTKDLSDCYFIEFIQKYKGIDVFNNYVKFNINKDGTFKIQIKYFKIKSSYSDAIDICSADEALFIFADEIKKMYAKEIIVSKIEKGYYFENYTKGKNIVSLPYYKIDIIGVEQSFFINAYNRNFVE